ncbi:hypothetical protein Avbf_18503, partial [Armadillidium vulgare]
MKFGFELINKIKKLLKLNIFCMVKNKLFYHYFRELSFSILFSPLLMSHSVSSTKISWIYNVYTLVWNLATIFIGPLCNEFGWRKIAIFGGIINSLSVLLSAFAPNPEFLMFSFSILGGKVILNVQFSC